MHTRTLKRLLCATLLGLAPSVFADTYTSETRSISREGPVVAPSPPTVSAESRVEQQTRTVDGRVERTTTKETLTNDGVTERREVKREQTVYE